MGASYSKKSKKMSKDYAMASPNYYNRKRYGSIDKRKTEDVIDYEVRNHSMYYLIIIREKDLMPRCFCWKPLRDELLKSKDEFTGKLFIENYDSFQKYNGFEFLEPDNYKQKHIYMRLPKEDKYVEIERFNYEYLKSQSEEFEFICSLLGVKSFKKYISDSSSSSSRLSLGFSVDFGNISGGSTIKSGRTNSMEFQFEDSKEFQHIPYKPTYDLFKWNTYLYYLKTEQTWKNMIEHRIERKLLKDTITYTFKSKTGMTKEFIQKLKVLNFDVSFEEQNSTEIVVKYEIEYNPFHEDYLEVNFEDESIDQILDENDTFFAQVRKDYHYSLQIPNKKPNLTPFQVRVKNLLKELKSVNIKVEDYYQNDIKPPSFYQVNSDETFMNGETLRYSGLMEKDKDGSMVSMFSNDENIELMEVKKEEKEEKKEEGIKIETVDVEISEST